MAEFARNGNLLLPERHEAQVDELLHAAFSEAIGGAPETYAELTLPLGQRQELERQFVESGFTLDVDLSLNGQLGPNDELERRVERLQEFKRTLIQRSDLPVYLIDAYRWRVNEAIAKSYMVHASREGDMDNFRRWNEFVYGRPNTALYGAALDWIAYDAEIMQSSSNSDLARVAQHVLSRIGGQRGIRNLLVPRHDACEDHWRSGGYYGQVMDGVELPLEGKVRPEMGDPALLRAMANIGLQGYALQNAEGATWSVSHGTKGIVRPSTYSMVPERFIGLSIGHEVGSRGLEAANGERGPIALLRGGAAGGMDRYEAGNEGRAVIREQVPYGSFEDFAKTIRWRDIMRRYIAISYAIGTGEDEPRSFHEVYDLVNTIDTMYQLKTKASRSLTPEQNADKAHAKTWTLVTRVLKGTDGSGGAYYKDLMYLEGNVACWVAAELYGPEVISSGDLGKFDITNPRHIAVLGSAGLLPEGAAQ